MLLIILSIIIFLVGCIFVAVAATGDNDYAIPMAITYFGISLFMVVAYYENKPKAIDVYSNKTTLEITYRGKVPVDSVVVFKK